MRKSPFRHKVRTYRRRTGRVVHQYERGKGAKPAEHHRLANPNMPKRESAQTHYNVHITYIDLPKETFAVMSSSYPSAIDEALSRRNHLTVPWHIRVSRV